MSDRLAPGVLPDSVSRNPHSTSWLIFVDLTADPQVIRQWLETVVTPAVQQLCATGTSDDQDAKDVSATTATCTVAFGGALFDKAGTAAMRPPGLEAALPPSITTAAHDVVLYVFATEDAPVAAFLRTIATTAVSAITIERGYQRLGGTEVFGQKDGLRNVVPNSKRREVAFVQAGQPDEPDWSTGGSYMSYLKIQQNLTAWNQLNPDAQAQVIGRRADGSRLDLPEGSDPAAEGAIAPGATLPPSNSHVRKVGPRESPSQDAVQILRRGTPYIEAVGGALHEGLHFVSYQASVDDYLTILERWMLNEAFPQAGTGADALVSVRPEGQLTNILEGGLYFAVPDDPRFIGAGMYDPERTDTGTLHIRLSVADAGASAPSMTASLDGALFRVLVDGGPTFDSAPTSASGHTTIAGLPTGVSLTVSQVSAPAGVTQVAAAQTIVLERCKPGVLRFLNTQTGTVSVYGA